MSTTIPPNVPAAETTPHASIVAAQTPLDVVNAAINNPVIMATFQKYAGNPNGLPAALAGLAVGYATTAWGLKLDAALVGPLTLAVAAAFGYGWNLISAKLLTPATPVTQGPK